VCLGDRISGRLEDRSRLPGNVLTAKQSNNCLKHTFTTRPCQAPRDRRSEVGQTPSAVAGPPPGVRSQAQHVGRSGRRSVPFAAQRQPASFVRRRATMVHCLRRVTPCGSRITRGNWLEPGRLEPVAVDERFSQPLSPAGRSAAQSPAMRRCADTDRDRLQTNATIGVTPQDRRRATQARPPRSVVRARLALLRRH